MISFQSALAGSVLALGVLLTSSTAFASPLVADTTLSFEAFDNGTIQSFGPASGPDGDAFFNIVGDPQNTFPSFAVADFQLTPSRLPIREVVNVTLELTQANTDFTADGPINIYFTTDYSDYTSLVFDATTTEGLGDQLTPLILLASYHFEQRASGAKDKAIQDLEAVKDGIRDYYLNGTDQRFRMVITSASADVAATFAGWSNSEFPGPTLKFDVVTVPEPSTVALLAMSTFGIMLDFKRRELFVVSRLGA